MFIIAMINRKSNQKPTLFGFYVVVFGLNAFYNIFVIGRT